MRIPIAYRSRCPDCGRVAVISMIDSWAYMLWDWYWECPYCHCVASTEARHKATAPSCPAASESTQEPPCSPDSPPWS
jgi:hypothetical protein